MLRVCSRSLERCFGRIGGGGGGGGDGLLWHSELKGHATGDYSIAVVQANSNLEDQSQVFTSPSVTYVGVYDGHGGPHASRFVNKHLFDFLLKFSTENGGLSADVIKMAFKETEDEFTRLVKRSLPIAPEIASAGSCCLLGAISNDDLYVANLGDSRAVLGRRIAGSKNGKMVAERLSNDHNVAFEEVRREVEALHPDDSHIVVYTRGVWRIKGIIQPLLISSIRLTILSSKGIGSLSHIFSWVLGVATGFDHASFDFLILVYGKMYMEWHANWINGMSSMHEMYVEILRCMAQETISILVFLKLSANIVGFICHFFHALKYGCFFFLLVSRSIGDVYLKKPEFNRDPYLRQFGFHIPLKRPVMTAEPSILVRKIKPEDSFLIFASDGLWEHLSDQAAVDIVVKNQRAGVAKRLVREAIQEAAKKREMRYNDIKKIEKGIRRHFHDDITVIVLYLDDKKDTTVKRSAVGCTTAPVDVFSLNADEEEGDEDFLQRAS
ncbi:hypothetical protein ACFE04_024366 [Oxalis oulophora]